MSLTNVIAIIPAAGRGSRLGLQGPKLLASITDESSVWTILRDKLLRVVDRIHLVVAPGAFPEFRSILSSDRAQSRVTLSIQDEPRGMGDAIFGASNHWAMAQTLLILWGDQIHISNATLEDVLLRHREGHGARCTIPVVMIDQPYVEYSFDEHDRLAEIRESREGSVCGPRGLSDVGTFVLEVKDLEAEWLKYGSSAKRGVATDEINFLPFLTWLSKQGWYMTRVEITDPLEARGINTMEDLQYFRELYRRPKLKKAASGEYRQD